MSDIFEIIENKMYYFPDEIEKVKKYIRNLIIENDNLKNELKEYKKEIWFDLED